MARIPNGARVIIVQPGNLYRLTGTIVSAGGMFGRSYDIDLDIEDGYVMVDDTTGKQFTTVTVGAVWIEELAERSVGR